MAKIPNYSRVKRKETRQKPYVWSFDGKKDVSVEVYNKSREKGKRNCWDIKVKKPSEEEILSGYCMDQESAREKAVKWMRNNSRPAETIINLNNRTGEYKLFVDYKEVGSFKHNENMALEKARSIARGQAPSKLITIIDGEKNVKKF